MAFRTYNNCLGHMFFLPQFFCRNKEKSQIYKDALLSIVEVKAVTESVGESFGTAEFVGDGKLITNAHVVTYKNLVKHLLLITYT